MLIINNNNKDAFSGLARFMLFVILFTSMLLRVVLDYLMLK